MKILFLILVTLSVELVNLSLAYTGYSRESTESIISSKSTKWNFTCTYEDDLTIFPNPNDCRFYYICAYGIIWNATCADDFLFDVELNQCTLSLHARCYKSEETTAAIEETTTVFPPGCKLFEKLPNENDCSSFLICTNEVSKWIYSCQDGLHFNRESGTCMEPRYANCILPCPSDSNNTFTQPDYSDCSRFYKCIDSEPVLHQCKEDLLFDAEYNRCDFDHVVSCGYRPIKTNPNPDPETTTEFVEPEPETTTEFVEPEPETTTDFVEPEPETTTEFIEPEPETTTEFVEPEPETTTEFVEPEPETTTEFVEPEPETTTEFVEPEPETTTEFVEPEPETTTEFVEPEPETTTEFVEPEPETTTEFVEPEPETTTEFVEPEPETTTEFVEPEPETTTEFVEPEPETTTEFVEPEPETTTEFVEPEPETTTEFVEPEPETTTEFVEPEPETTTESETESTTRESTTKNPNKFEDCPLESGITYHPHSVDCTKYFRCEFGTGELLRCLKGKQFDVTSSKCSENATCFNAF